MAHKLKTGAIAEKHRNIYRSRRDSHLLAETSISFEAAQRRLIELRNGQRKTIVGMTDNEFRDWYYGIIERLAVRIKPDEHKVKTLINTVKRESYSLRLDETTRWYLVDKLYGTQTFRESGIELFVRTEEVVA